jgi:transposase-like protein
MLVSLEALRQSFFDLCIAAGQEVLSRALEEDRTALCGPKGQHDAQRQAVRWGKTSSEVTLGGRRVTISRPRVRAVDGGELSLPWFDWAADRDPLNERTLEQVAVGVSTRHYARSLEPTPEGLSQRAVSKSAVSRRFVALTKAQLRTWLSRPLSDLDLRVVIIDGIDFQDRILLISLGIAADGSKHVLGLREGATENATVGRSLLRDLIDRGLPSDQAMLFVIDGGKGIHKAITETYGRLALIQRCQVHKKRNVLGHLPEELKPSVGRMLNQAYRDTDSAKLAQRQLQQLASSLEQTYPSAAASVEEGLEETLTVLALGVDKQLYRSLRSTNPIENLNRLVRKYTSNVTRWRNGLMVQRWVAMGLVEAEKNFRRLTGHRFMRDLIAKLDEHQRALELDNEEAVA